MIYLIDFILNYCRIWPPLFIFNLILLPMSGRGGCKSVEGYLVIVHLKARELSILICKKQNKSQESFLFFFPYFFSLPFSPL